MASETVTGSIEGIADSTGLLPLASGVIETTCDWRLDGTVPGGDALCGCGFFGGVGRGAVATGGDTTAGGSKCGGRVPAGGAVVETGETAATEARVCGVTSGVDGGGCVSGDCAPEGGVWSLGVALVASPGAGGCSAFPPKLFGFFSVGSTTGTT